MVVASTSNLLTVNEDQPCLVEWPFQPAWASKAIKKSVILLKLAAGWDGRDAPRISPMHIANAFEILSKCVESSTPAPSIVPTVHRGIQIEWHAAGFNVELSVDDRGISLYAGADLDDSFELERKGAPAVNALRTCIQILTARRAALKGQVPLEPVMLETWAVQRYFV